MNKHFKLSQLFYRYKYYFIAILILIIIEPTVSSWLYFWLSKMYNDVGIGTSKATIFKLLGIGIMIWMLKRLLLFITTIVKSKLLCEIKTDIKHDLFMNVMHLNTGSIESLGDSGSYVSAFTNDITMLEQRYFSNLISLVSQFFSLIILGSSFFTLDATLASYVFMFGSIVMVIPLFFSRHVANKNLLYSNRLASFTQRIKEYFHAFPMIKNYAIESYVESKFNTINQNVEDSKFYADYSLSLADSVGSMLSWFMQIVVIGVGLIKIAKGQMALGTVMAGVAFSQDLANPLQGFVGSMNSIRSIKEVVRKISKMTKLEKERDTIRLPLENQKTINLIFDHLSVMKNNKTIVDDFTFTFEGGKKYLMVGHNGSGKSSVCKALKQHFEDYDGHIYLNEYDVSYLNNQEMSKYIAYLNENVSLLSESVKDNIILNRTCTLEDYHRVIKEANIQMDDQHMVGEDGCKASSGEKRRIEIARSLLNKSKVMIFDEVVSTLDIQTAYDIEKMILTYSDQTIIFISHNFSGKLIKEYDEILVMNHGKLIDHGHYHDLINRCDYFRNICEIKFGAI